MEKGAAAIVRCFALGEGEEIERFCVHLFFAINYSPGPKEACHISGVKFNAMYLTVEEFRVLSQVRANNSGRPVTACRLSALMYVKTRWQA